MEGFMEVELMVTKRDDDDDDDDDDRQGEYRAICLWKMDWQSFAIPKNQQIQNLRNDTNTKSHAQNIHIQVS